MALKNKKLCKGSSFPDITLIISWPKIPPKTAQTGESLAWETEAISLSKKNEVQIK